MGEGVGGGDPAEVGSTPERAAGGGEHQPLHRARALRADELEEGRVLGVDRDDPRVRGLGERGHELAAHHQALLVGERQLDALGKRHDRRPETRGADDSVQNQVGAGAGDQLLDALLTGEHAAVPGRRGRSGCVGIGERDGGHAVVARLLDQALPAPGGGEADDGQLI
jgi:hypothetical protein